MSAMKFQNFFNDKIDGTHENINKDTTSNYLYPNLTNLHMQINTFCEFMPSSDDDIIDIVKSLNDTYCDLDVFPPSLFKECLDILRPILKFIVNCSLLHGIFPDNRNKPTLVNPRLKEDNVQVSH